jgi:L-rhamnose isomerase
MIQPPLVSDDTKQVEHFFRKCASVDHPPVRHEAFHVSAVLDGDVAVVDKKIITHELFDEVRARDYFKHV